MQDSTDDSQLSALFVGGLVALLKGRRRRLRRFRAPDPATLGLVAKYVSDRARGAGVAGRDPRSHKATIVDLAWCAEMASQRDPGNRA